MHQIYCPKQWSRWLFCVILLLSLDSYAYSSQDSGRITLHVIDQPIEKVLRQIESQTGYAFFYGYSTLDPNSLVSVSADRYRLSQVMDILLKGRNVSWRIKDNGIILSKKQSADVKINSTYTSTDTLPKVTIKGTVTAEEGFSLPGATIKVKNGSGGTATNSNGVFILNNIPDRSIISISYTGYQTQEYSIKGFETIVVKLKRSINSLDEQVVIAYGTSSKRMLTGSVGKIKGDVIARQPVTNTLAALQGQVPGLTITQQTGVPGGGFRVYIRGANSLRNSISDYQNGNSGNDPLYIIDGIPYFSKPQSMSQVSSTNGIFPLGVGANPLNSLNPSDIESVEILKDGDATAIYGSRGANGVILITTKSGKVGSMKVDANVYYGIGKVTRKMKLLNTAQYLEMRTEGFANDGVTNYPASAYDVNGVWNKNRETDWQEELIGGTARSTDAQVSLSGGSILSQYRISGGYHKETTVYPGDFSFRRASFSAALNNSSINQKFKSTFIINYSNSLSNLLSQDLTYRALRFSPNAPALYDSLGNLNFQNSTFQNPLAYTKQPYDSRTNALIGNAVFTYEIVNGLSARLNVGYTNTLSKQVLKFPISAMDPNLAPVLKENRASFQNSTNSSWNVEPQLVFSKEIMINHRFEVLVGTTFQREESDLLNQQATGFLSESLMENVGAVPAANVTNTYNNSLYSYNAVFGRVNYNFKRKYILNLTGRRDGSSRFGPGKQFANFGSVGAAWIISEEEMFKKHVGIINFAKIRTSYGTTGSDQIANYGFLDTYTTTGARQYQNTVGLKPSQLVNPDFSWESTSKAEIAADFEFAQSRFKGSISYYKNRSTNQLVGYPLPSSTGFDIVQFNLPAVIENKGWEFEVFSKNLSSKDFKWITSVNISFPKNKLVSYPNFESSSYFSTYVIGEPIFIRKLYKYTGLDPQTGLHTSLDYDGNGVYNTADRIINKFVGQRYYGGVSNSVTFKNFQVDFLFQFVKQDAPNYISDFATMPGEMTNFPVEVMDRWRKPGDVTKIQKFSNSKSFTAYSRYLASNEAISDASYIRFKNIAVSYSFSRVVLQRVKIQNARVYCNLQNILTITKYRGLDPETQGSTLPPLRQLTVGVQLGI